MSGIRAVELGPVLPDGDDPPPACSRAMSYDFSRWNAPDEPEIVERSHDNGTSVSFKVYTPSAIKLAPMPVRRPPPAPVPEEGLKDVHEAIAIAKSLGVPQLLARFGAGVVAGALVLIAIIGFAFLADDPPEAHAMTPSTEMPSAAGVTAPPPQATPYGAVEELDDLTADVAGSAYFELPAPGSTDFELPDSPSAPQKPSKTARGSGKAGGAKRTIVR